MEISRQTQPHGLFWKLPEAWPAVLSLCMPLCAGGSVSLFSFQGAGQEMVISWPVAEDRAAGHRAFTSCTSTLPFLHFLSDAVCLLGFSTVSHQLLPLHRLWKNSQHSVGPPPWSSALGARRTCNNSPKSVWSCLCHSWPTMLLPSLPHLLQHCSWNQVAVLDLASLSILCGPNPSDLGKS